MTVYYSIFAEMRNRTAPRPADCRGPYRDNGSRLYNRYAGEDNDRAGKGHRNEGFLGNPGEIGLVTVFS